MEFNYNPISKKKFKNTANIRSSHCITIYIPTFKKGKEQNLHLSQGHLRRSINKVKKILLAYHFTEKNVKEYIKPIEDIFNNVDLWRSPSDSLVFFLNSKGLEFYKIPVKIDNEIVYVSDHFYMAPLANLFSDDHNYFILELSQDYIKFYQASKFMLKEVYIEDITPKKIEEVIGHDFRQKMFQFRTGQAVPAGVGSFHGHGEGKDEDKLEIQKFFRAINNGLKNMLYDKKEPLILACVDYLFPIYKGINKYPNLLDDFLSGDPETINKKELHTRSWQIIMNNLCEKKPDLLKFNELRNTSKVSYQLNEIIPAAVRGKIHTLFIRKNSELYGFYKKEDDTIILDNQKEMNNISLLNLVVKETLEQGGKIHFLEPNEMPEANRIFNAIFRY